MSTQTTIGVGQTSVAGFPGSQVQARILGTLYVLAGYGIIFSVLVYVLAFGSSIIVISVRVNCIARAGAPVVSVLYGHGTSPLCGNDTAGQLLSLVPPLLELLLALILIRGPPPANGAPLSSTVEATIRSVLVPISPRIAALRLRQWNRQPKITSHSLLLNQGLIDEFEHWSGTGMPDPRLPRTQGVLFPTLHEIGHLACHDVLYSRGADRAIPLAACFVALFLLVTMPAGSLAGGYWLSVVLTAVECVAAVLATRYILGGILTNFEFLMDNFAAAQGIPIAGRRFRMPALQRETARSRLRRSHPTLAMRREYLRSMQCSGFLWVFALALPYTALLEFASSPSRETIAAIGVLTVFGDLISTVSLCIMGAFGGAAAARGGFKAAWWCYGLVAAFFAVLLLTHGFFDIPPFGADAARRLSLHGRSVLWTLVLSAPLVGLVLRRRTAWFDAAPAGTPVPPVPPALSAPPPSAWTVDSAARRLPAAIYARAKQAWSVIARGVYHGCVTFAAAEAGVFGFVVLLYIVDTGIFSWVHVACFAIYFAVPLSHALRPLWRLPLVLDLTFQVVFLSLTVIVLAALSFAHVIGTPGMPPPDDMIGTGSMMMTGPALAMRSIVDGSLFRLRGAAIFRDILWLWVLFAIIGYLRLTGQRLERRRRQEEGSGNQ